MYTDDKKSFKKKKFSSPFGFSLSLKRLVKKLNEVVSIFYVTNVYRQAYVK